MNSILGRGKKIRDFSILVVEDSPTQAEYLKYILDKEGFQVIVVGDGKEALKYAASQKPSVVISDIVMPEMDGFELCRRIKQDQSLAGIPVVLLTSLSDPADVIKGLECGADNFITKPYDENYLVNRIKNIILSGEIRKDEVTQFGLEINFAGKKHFINSDRLQILNLLISTYENAVQINHKLRETQRQLADLNLQLERKVEERTSELIEEINERKKAQEEKEKLQDQLLHSQKMEAIGSLAGGIAHDFNNLLTVIIGYCDVVLGKMSGDDQCREQLEEIQAAGTRAAALTRQLLAFSRKQVLQPVAIDLNSIVEGMDKMLRRVIGEDIDLLTQLHPGLYPVKFDPGQIEQIIVNLAVNARDAMPSGGKLTIETGNVELSEEYAGNHANASAGPHVMLAISDTGVGMEASTKARIFEPFFTTKEMGRGTGLGLSTVYGIVSQSGGTIWVYSEPGQGTTFKVYLPRTEEGVVEYKPYVEEPDVIGGTETILVVEDDKSVRGLVLKLLVSNGYKVHGTSDVDTAFELARNSGHEIDLLITDVVLPKMKGPQLAEEMLSLCPGLKIIFMSGYTDLSIFRSKLIGPNTVYLEKPISPNCFLRKVREVLDS